jgi:hypothetical protein
VTEQTLHTLTGGPKSGVHFNMCFAEDFSDNDIWVSYQPGRDSRVKAAAEFPDLGADLSGCSGGPVLMHVERNGFHRWFVIGMIIAGSGDYSGESPKGTMAE